MSLISDKLHFLPKSWHPKVNMNHCHEPFFRQIAFFLPKSWRPKSVVFLNPKPTFAANFCQIDPNVLNQKFCFVQIEFFPTKWLHEGVSVGWSAGWSVYRMVHRFKSDSQNLSNIFFEISYIFCPKINFSSWIALFSQARCFIQYAQIALF